MKTLVSSFLLLCLAGGLPAWAQERGKSRICNVRVDVLEAEDSEFTSTVRSFILRELRSLGDVVVVEDRTVADKGLLLIPIKHKLEGGVVSGFVMTILMLDYFSEKEFDALMKTGKIDPGEHITLSMLKAVTTGLYIITDVWYRSGPMDSLKRNSEGIVAVFDTQHLEPWRKSAHRQNLKPVDVK